MLHARNICDTIEALAKLLESPGAPIQLHDSIVRGIGAGLDLAEHATKARLLLKEKYENVCGNAIHGEGII